MICHLNTLLSNNLWVFYVQRICPGNVSAIEMSEGEVSWGNITVSSQSPCFALLLNTSLSLSPHLQNIFKFESLYRSFSTSLSSPPWPETYPFVTCIVEKKLASLKYTYIISIIQTDLRVRASTRHRGGEGGRRLDYWPKLCFRSVLN